MPLFDRDPEISRRFGLGLGAGLLNTHGRPAGAIMSEALMLGQKNADAERDLRVKDATARYYGQRGQTDLFTVAKEAHKQRLAQWEIQAASAAYQGRPVPPMPGFDETLMMFGVQQPAGSPPAGQPAPIGSPGGSGQPPAPKNAPSASQPGQLGSGTAGIVPPPPGASLIPGAMNLPHHGPPGRPEPLGPAQAGPAPTMADMAPLQSNTGAAPQQGPLDPMRRGTRYLDALLAAGLAPSEAQVNAAKSMRPFEAGGNTYFPFDGTRERNLPEGFRHGPNGAERVPNLAEQQGIVKNLERSAELGFNVQNAPYINRLEQLKAQSTEAGRLLAQTELGRGAAKATARGTTEGQYAGDQAPSAVPGLRNKALGAIDASAGNVRTRRNPDGSTSDVLQGEALPPGTGASIPTGPSTEQQLKRRATELRQDTVAQFDRGDYEAFRKDTSLAVDKARTAAQQDDAIEAMRPNISITGKLTPFAAGVGGWLTALGVAPNYVRDFTSSAQSLGALINDQVIKNSVVLEGQLSNRDMIIVQASYANLGHTPEGNAFILDFMSAVNERIQMRAQLLAGLDPLVRSGQISKLEAQMRVEDKMGASVFDTEAMKGWRYLVGKE